MEIKNFNLKKIFFLLVASIFIAAQAIAQTADYGTFIIKSNGSVTDVAPYVHAMKEANMEAYRLLDTRVTITFNTDLQITLFSAKEILARGKKIDLANYDASKPANYVYPIFSIGPDGCTIMAGYTHPYNPKDKYGNGNM